MRVDVSQKDNISLKVYFKDVRKFDQINGDEQVELAIKAKNGDEESLNKLVHSNLRFVLKIAREYLYTGVPLEDLIQEGNLGIIKAVEKFNPDKGFKFISYAVWWVRQSIIQSIYENNNSVRIPINRINIINKVNKATEVLYKELNREPSIEEICNYYKNKKDVKDITEKEVLYSYYDDNFDISLNSTISDDCEGELHELIESDMFNDFEKSMNDVYLKNEIDNVLSELTARENKILRMYFGIGEFQEMNLAEIGESIGLTNERVRQIKEFALKKLRTYSNSNKLREFLGCEF